MPSTIVIIAGATASGKSSIALCLAQKTGGVIINADSQQMYAELPILSARPTPAEESAAPHKLYGMLGANEACSAGKWLRLAQMEIDWALSMGTTTIVVGGTGLYIKALMQGIAAIPPIDETVRQQVMNDYEQMGKDAFMERLRAIDPAFFERLKVYDRQRLIRAHEVWLGTGKTLSWWQGREVKPPYPPQQIALYHVERPREELYARCNARFDAMLETGALEEVERFMQHSLDEQLPIMKTLGLRELSAHLRGELSLAEASEKAKQATRNYAKRQLTWVRNQFPAATPIHSASDIVTKS
jgi:tRNA dimethylallyltransferase